MYITCISMSHIMPYMVYLKSLLKILLQVMDLNISYKTHKTTINTRNVTSEKRAISRSSASFAPFLGLVFTIIHLLLSGIHFTLPLAHADH